MASIKALIYFFVATTCLAGCASKLEDVSNPDAPTMKQVYEQYAGSNTEKLAERKTELQTRPAVEEPDLQLGLPPYPERLDHLYPRLPNPDLFMYVRPHAVGATGAPIPAYITRFSMYERQPYALPGETLQAAKIITSHDSQKRVSKSEKATNSKSATKSRELFHE